MTSDQHPEAVTLTSVAIRELKKRAHGLRPTVRVGQQGVHEGLLEELDHTLEAHELVKVKVNAGDRGERDALIEVLIRHTGARLIQRIGNMAVLFRPRQKESKAVHGSGHPSP